MSVDFVRATMNALAERAAQDSAYHQKLKDDPLGVLSAAGFPEDVVKGLIAADAEERDVHGYSMPTVDTGCNDTTCWTSNCPSTCNVSLCGTTYAN
jgi:hypothetical protein